MKDDERKEAPFRLMQALSGVDEELLERSEKQENRSRSVRRMAGRWGYAFAACLTLAVAGTSVYCVNRFGNEKISGMESAVNFAMDAKSGDGVEALEEAAEARQDVAMDGITNDAAGTADTAGAQDSETTSGGKDTAQNSTGTTGGRDAMQGNAETGEALYAQEAELTQAQQLTWEQAAALDGLGSHVPTDLPAEYSLQKAVYGKGIEGQDVLLLYFADGQQGLLLRLEETAQAPDMQSAADYPVYRETEDWQTFLTEAEQDGQVRLGLLLEDGTLISYQGALSAETLCRLLDSSIR